MFNISGVRQIRNAGRITIPREILYLLDIKFNDYVEIYTDRKRVILKKYTHGCEFCGSVDDTVLFFNKNLCRKCINYIKSNCDPGEPKLVELHSEGRLQPVSKKDFIW